MNPTCKCGHINLDHKHFKFDCDFCVCAKLVDADPEATFLYELRRLAEYAHECAVAVNAAVEALEEASEAHRKALEGKGKP